MGPTGVGKTLLAKEVSKWLFDEHRGLIRIDMSEYGEKHNVARLIGSPPGYVGYGEGGQLTEAVRRQPYSVVLFDEIEKAHPEVFNSMLQIFDEGHLTDGSGRKVDFRNTIIIMTSNVGSRNVVQKSVQVGYSTVSKSATAVTAPQCEYRKALEQTFAPEFLNRIDDIVLFRTLEISDVERIIELELQGLFERTRRLGYKVKITDGAKRRLAAMGYESRYGVRSLEAHADGQRRGAALRPDHRRQTPRRRHGRRRIGQVARRPDTRGVTAGRFSVFPLQETGFRPVSFFVPTIFLRHNCLKDYFLTKFVPI